MNSTTRATAEAFIAARRAAKALPGFPGDIPASLAEAYAIQDAAISMWDDEVAGWKIGRINGEAVQRLGAERLAGPVFSKYVWRARDGVAMRFPAFAGGFAAVEAEYIYRIAQDAPAQKMSWTAEEALLLVGAMHIGAELAGSPLASINALGPTVVVSDFGNNHGVILGPEIPDWRVRADSTLIAETFIDGRSIGRGGASNVLGGPVGSLVFLLENLAARGRPLRAGQYVSTGAVTGVHDIAIGQTAKIRFEGLGEIDCIAEQATSLDARALATQT